MSKKKKTCRQKNQYAKDLRTPKYKKRVVPDKKKKTKEREILRDGHREIDKI